MLLSLYSAIARRSVTIDESFRSARERLIYAFDRTSVADFVDLSLAAQQQLAATAATTFFEQFTLKHGHDTAVAVVAAAGRKTMHPSRAERLLHNSRESEETTFFPGVIHCGMAIALNSMQVCNVRCARPIMCARRDSSLFGHSARKAKSDRAEELCESESERDEQEKMRVCQVW